jgi:hypothetical protein
MASGVKCPKCGMTQLSSPKCKSCGAALGASTDRPVQSRASVSPSGSAPRAAVTGSPAADYPEVREIQRLEKYDLASILPAPKGFRDRRAARKKVALLARVSPVLARLLGEEERVLFVTRGTIQYLAEIFLGNGFLTYCYNIHAFVFTNRRIIVVNVTSAGRPKRMIHQIEYGDIQKWSGPSALGGAVVLKLHDRTKLTLVHIPRKEARAAKELVGRLQASAAPASTPGTRASFRNLCPSCFVPVPKATYACPECRATFKTPRKAALRSFLLPGWGDIYLTHRALGALELLGSAFLIFLFVATLATAGVEEAMALLVILLFYHCLDAGLTYHMGKKGLIPERGTSA